MNHEAGGPWEGWDEGNPVMGTTVEDLVRLAWQSEIEGKPGTRDALLTLAVAEGDVDELVLAEKARRVLVLRRPDHWFASPAPMSQWMDNPQVVTTLSKLRAMFPPVRVRHMLMRGAAQRGPFSGRVASPSRLLLDLVPSTTPPAPHIKLKTPKHVITPVVKAAESPVRSQEYLVAFYWSVLMAMAVLLNALMEPGTQDRRK